MTRPTTLPDLLTRAVEHHADRPAIVLEDRVLTYGELDAQSNRMAHSMIRHGVRPGDRVAMWLPRSIEAIVSLWGIMKCGAAYAAVDPMAPAAWLGRIARDCQVAGLVTTRDRADVAGGSLANDSAIRAVWIAESGSGGSSISAPAVGWNEIAAESAEPPPVRIEGDDLAAVQYTSGSTGTPKGVMAPHRAFVSQAEWTRESFDLVPEDRLLGQASIHFAMSSFDLFAAVTVGATAYSVPPHLAPFPGAIAKSLSEQRLTTCYVVPSLLVMMLGQADFASLDLSSMRLISFAGETFALERLGELMSRLPWVRFVHSYSRTEIKIRSYHEVKFPPIESDPRRIGALPSDCRAFVLDDEARPVPNGGVGELWVSGPALMRGYLGLPELTAQVLRTIEPTPGEPILACRSGDLVRLGEGGAMEFAGRADQQVKIRGHRVETGEVEAALTRHPAIAQAAVIALPDRTSGGKRLKAIVVLKDGAQTDDHTLRRHCAEILPSYMIPEAIEFRRSMPLNSTGKVDRRALSEDRGDKPIPEEPLHESQPGREPD